MNSPTRPLLFAGVGAIGLATQLAVLATLTGWGVPVPAATAAAVGAAVVHNFLWHRRLTWGDRPTAPLLPQLLRFSGLNGLVSLVGNVAVTSTLSSSGVPLVVANLAAVALCAAANFILADRLVFAAVLALAVAVPGEAATLHEATLDGWNEYVQRTEQRIASAQAGGRVGITAAEWRGLKAGELVILDRATTRPDGSGIDVPDGAVHHWVGRVFLPGLTLDALLAELQSPTSRRWTPAEVLSMRVVPDGRGSLRVTMRLKRSSIVEVSYDTEHAVRYVRHSPTHATSRSVSTRIQQIDDPGTPGERLRPPGDDHGFLWRLNAYWRYTAVDGGVLVECESLALSRSVPMLLRVVASPVVARVSRESLAGTLQALRRGFARS
jgi:putative flippase GtrA